MSDATRDLTLLLARAAEETRRHLEEQIAEAEAWLPWVARGAPGGNGCVGCDSLVRTDGHHIAGRRHGNIVVPACVNCHRYLSRLQNRTDPRWQSKKRSSVLDESLLILGIADLCELRAHYRGPAYVEMAERLRALYAVRGRETIS
jgi:hypothetical protein